MRHAFIAVLILLVSCQKDTSDPETWIVVQGVLVEGEYAQVRLTHPVAFEASSAAEGITGAIVLLDGPNGTVRLSEIAGSNGVYSDTSGEMQIEAGATYSLSVSKGDEKVFATAQVPASIGLVQSSATSIPIDPASTGQPIYSIFWTQVEGFTHVLTLDVQEELPIQIPFSVNAGNFDEQYAFPVPGQGTTIFDTDFYYYGNHKLTVFAIPEAYDAIFFYQNGTGGEQVTEGPDNIEGGSGYFTAVSKLEVDLEIFEE